MRALVPACAIALALGVSASAQDSTVTSKTKVEADDARTVVMTGCLQQAPGSSIYTLAGRTAAAGEDLTITSKVKTDVDDDDTTVRTETAAKVDHDDDDRKAVGTSGATMTYEVMARDGVDLAAHVGRRVEIAAVMLDPADGDDDAEIEIETKTKTRVDDAPDRKAKTSTEVELPRGAHARLTALSVKPLGGGCQ
jgi:hypothetical protein